MSRDESFCGAEMAWSNQSCLLGAVVAFLSKFLAGVFARCILVGFGGSRFVGGLSGDSVESLYPYRLDIAAECAVLLSILCVSSCPYILRSMSRLPT